jgi:hypothetical protein
MYPQPWHSVKTLVHHDTMQCSRGTAILTKHLRDGTGGKPLCPCCATQLAPHRPRRPTAPGP